MNQMNLKTGVKRPFVRLIGAFFLILIAAVIVAFVFLASARRAPQPDHPPAAPAQSAAGVTSPPAPTGMNGARKSPATPAAVLPNWPGFQARPFPAAYQSAEFQWTLADGKDTNVIRELAHNRLEYDRMVEENPRIFRRELVYLKQTASSVFEQAKLTGKPVSELTLPGVDGQELQFQIVQRDGNGSSRRGTFSGHLVGDLNSMVTMAFMDGREAFTVLAPGQSIFVVGEPREDGQVIVKAIDPNTYGMGPAENADDTIKTGPPKK
jgi:hypothetical protein